MVSCNRRVFDNRNLLVFNTATMSLFPEQYVYGFKMLSYFAISFLLAMWLAPVLIKTLNKLEWWKKKIETRASTGEKLQVINALKKKVEGDRNVPRSGGILIWATTLIIALVFYVILKIFPDNQTSVSFSEFLNFVDWRQTFIPIGVLIGGALLGLVDDYLVTRKDEGNYFAGGLKLSHRAIGVVAMAGFIGWWFHARIGDLMHTITLPWWTGRGWQVLDLRTIHLPLDWLDSITRSVGFDWQLANGGWLIIPITIVILTMLWSTAIIDGFDGLAAGTLIPVYLSFTGLAYIAGFYNIATLLAVISGALVAYLWHNIPPARFFMGDTGSTPLLLVLGTVAMLIDKLFVLPITGLILFATMGSALIQVISKKLFGRKVFLAAPLHHHLEAKGWPRAQVTMRYWLISLITSVLGFAFGIIVGANIILP
jgi:phospho-N-acetylmuramoyl-pentapeptide-transferase